MVDLDSQSDQADRDRRDRQAVADDARGADDVLDRQRRGQVFRDHSGGVRHAPIPQLERAQRHAVSRHRHSAILSAVIFNALIIIALIPLALTRREVSVPIGAARLLRRNLLIYGVGGIIAAVRRHQDHRRAAGRAAAT